MINMYIKIINEQNIEKSYVIIARIIRDYGDDYLPIFERIHEIREGYKSNQNLKNMALQIAGSSIG